jgi:phosphopantothenoylcysteine synthetase/decarboxylase
MRCIVTAGPTFEPLDQVRRLTNFSTGRLGTELANRLFQQGLHVTLMIGVQATWAGRRLTPEVIPFTTTNSLAERLAGFATADPVAVFHTAAVSDFSFGRIWSIDEDGVRHEINGGKISTRAGRLQAELLPTTKLIAGLRSWFPHGLLTGWKYEVDGDRNAVIAKAVDQIRENSTDLCIANGPAYGDGFGVVSGDGKLLPCADREALFEALSGRLGRS